MSGMPTYIYPPQGGWQPGWQTPAGYGASMGPRYPVQPWPMQPQAAYPIIPMMPQVPPLPMPPAPPIFIPRPVPQHPVPTIPRHENHQALNVNPQARPAAPPVPARKPFNPDVSASQIHRLTDLPEPRRTPAKQEAPHGHPHEHPETSEMPKAKGPWVKRIRWKSLAAAAGLFLAGRWLHVSLKETSAPLLQEARLFSADWKDWACLVLGIITVDKINKGFDWKPPAWLGAVVATAVMHPLAVGFSWAGLKQMVTMAPLVAVIVETNNFLNNKLGPLLDEKFHIPQLVTKVAISAGMIATGLAVAGRLFLGVCLRGCCTGSVICFTELAEIFAGLKAGHDRNKQKISHA